MAEYLGCRMLPGTRMRFHVELNPEEVNFVSWKKLLKESHRGGLAVPEAINSSDSHHSLLLFDAVAASGSRPPAGAHPALEARIAPLTEAPNPENLAQKDASSGHQRFSAVIEKIERLYKGNTSDEEETGAVPDDEQYDTEDSFIDDTELDEYFSVEQTKTKHTGFFVNRGKLERVNEVHLPPVDAPRKRRRKETKSIEHSKEIPNNLVKIGGPVRLKAAARNAPLVARNAVADSGDYKPAISVHLSDNKPVRKVEPNFANMTNGILRTNPLKSSDLFNKTNKSSLDIAMKPSHSSGHAGINDKKTPLAEPVYDSKNSNMMKAMDKKQEIEDPATMDATVSKTLSCKVRPCLQNQRDSSIMRPKYTMLEKAFQELERGVAELCPADMGEAVQPYQDVKKRRLPREVKQKLGKVARLAARHGKISNDVVERLMFILGHMMQIKTLKRNLKEMVNLGISAKREKEDKIQHIKEEVTQKVLRMFSAQTQNPRITSSGDTTGCYKLDTVTEDLLCDLYDQYIEVHFSDGMDEHRGPQIKKLYTEIAGIWPEGMMDKRSIKEAVNRAKERRKQWNKLNISGAESSKIKKATTSNTVELWNGEGTPGVRFSNNEITLNTKQTLEQTHVETVNNGNFSPCIPTDRRASIFPEAKEKYKARDENRDLCSNKISIKLEENPINRKRKSKFETGTDDTYTNSMRSASPQLKEVQADKGLCLIPVDKNNNIKYNFHPSNGMLQFD